MEVVSQNRFSVGTGSRFPPLILTNLHSLNNKVDAIRTYKRYCKEFCDASLICFTESNRLFPITSLKCPDSLQCAQTEMQLAQEKLKGGGICVYINDLWCRVHSVKYKICDSNVEILSMLRPFYLPREFKCILLFVVYHEVQLNYPDTRQQCSGI